MELSPMRRYRRYRHNNRYDAPLTIFVADAFISFGRIAIVAALLGALWFIASSYKNDPGSPVVATESKAATEADTATAESTDQTNASVEVNAASQSKTAALSNVSTNTVATTPALVGKATNKLQPNHAQATETPNPVPANNAQVVDGQWINNQNPNLFIVQLGSSPDLDLLREFATEIQTIEPIAIYEYKKTPSGKPVYGLATGMYSDLDTGLAEVKQMPQINRQFGPWVRPVKDLQKLITGVAN